MRRPAIFLLALSFGGLPAGGLRDPRLWSAAAIALWIFSAWRPVSWRSAALRGWVVWFAWAALSQAGSDQPLKGVFALSRWAGVIAFYGLALAHFEEKDREKWFWSLCAAATLLAAGCFLRVIPGLPMAGLIPPYYNYSMFVIAAGVCAALYADGFSGERLAFWRRRALWGVIALGVFTILAARSRSALAAVLFSFSTWMIRRGRARELSILAVGPLVFAVVTSAGVRGYALKLDKLEAFRRPQIWEVAARVASDHPLLGEGLGNFEEGFARHNFPAEGMVRYGNLSDYAHSEPLQAAAETGWVGLALFIAAAAALLRSFFPSSLSRYQEAAFGATIAMGCQCLFDNMLQVPALAMVFFASAACARPTLGAPAPPASERDRFLWRAMSAVCLVLACVAWLPRRAAEAALEAARGEQDGFKRLAAAERAARIYPADFYARELLAQAYLRSEPPMPTSALAELERAQRLNPTNALYPEMKGELYLGGGRDAEAERFASEAIVLEPNYLGARLLRAEALAREGKKAEARAELAEVERRRPALDSNATASGYERAIISMSESRRRAILTALDK